MSTIHSIPSLITLSLLLIISTGCARMNDPYHEVWEGGTRGVFGPIATYELNAD